MTAQVIPDLKTDLSTEEREALDDFLAAPVFDERAMDLATLEGFLTALVIGSSMVTPSRWMPWIWDRIDGQAQAPFEYLDEANWALGLVMRLYKGPINRFMTDPAGFEPIFLQAAEWGLRSDARVFSRAPVSNWSLGPR